MAAMVGGMMTHTDKTEITSQIDACNRQVAEIKRTVNASSSGLATCAKIAMVGELQLKVARLQDALKADARAVMLAELDAAEARQSRPGVALRIVSAIAGVLR